MNVEEKERLIKKDIAMIENKVRHAFNQGYEMGVKKSKEQSGDAISRQAVLEVIKSMPNDNPSYWNRCDVINRENTLDEIKDLPTVTPQQRTGRWRKVSMDKYIQHATYYYECSECGDQHIGQVNYCPNCGTKMEVSGCTKNI